MLSGKIPFTWKRGMDVSDPTESTASAEDLAALRAAIAFSPLPLVRAPPLLGDSPELSAAILSMNQQRAQRRCHAHAFKRRDARSSAQAGSALHKLVSGRSRDVDGTRHLTDALGHLELIAPSPVLPSRRRDSSMPGTPGTPFERERSFHQRRSPPTPAGQMALRASVSTASSSSFRSAAAAHPRSSSGGVQPSPQCGSLRRSPTDERRWGAPVGVTGASAWDSTLRSTGRKQTNPESANRAGSGSSHGGKGAATGVGSSSNMGWIEPSEAPSMPPRPKLRDTGRGGGHGAPDDAFSRRHGAQLECHKPRVGANVSLSGSVLGLVAAEDARGGRVFGAVGAPSSSHPAQRAVPVVIQGVAGVESLYPIERPQ